jgi:hypothetical protein
MISRHWNPIRSVPKVRLLCRMRLSTPSTPMYRSHKPTNCRPRLRTQVCGLQFAFRLKDGESRLPAFLNPHDLIALRRISLAARDRRVLPHRINEHTHFL